MAPNATSQAIADQPVDRVVAPIVTAANGLLANYTRLHGAFTRLHGAFTRLDGTFTRLDDVCTEVDAICTQLAYVCKARICGSYNPVGGGHPSTLFEKNDKVLALTDDNGTSPWQSQRSGATFKSIPASHAAYTTSISYEYFKIRNRL
ncbi:hypothetical protein LTR65_008289 [Meristemomyces frigidus]